MCIGWTSLQLTSNPWQFVFARVKDYCSSFFGTFSSMTVTQLLHTVKLPLRTVTENISSTKLPNIVVYEKIKLVKETFIVCSQLDQTKRYSLWVLVEIAWLRSKRHFKLWSTKGVRCLFLCKITHNTVFEVSVVKQCLESACIVRLSQPISMYICTHQRIIPLKEIHHNKGHETDS